MLTHRCEIFAPLYAENEGKTQYESRGKVWAKIELAYANIKNLWVVKRDQSPPAQPLYTILLRTNHLCERGWRVAYKGQIFSILSEPIFHNQNYHQYFMQALGEADR